MNASALLRTIGPWTAALGLCAGLAAAGPAASAPVLSVEFSHSPGVVADPVTARVHIAQAVDLYAFQFNIVYLPGMVQGTAATEAGFLGMAGPITFLPGSFDPGLGQWTGLAASLNGPIGGATGSGDLVNFEFTPLMAGVADFSLSDVLLLDSTGNLITGFTVQNASLTVQDRGGSVVSEPLVWPLVIALALLSPVLLGFHRRAQAADPQQ